MHPRTFAAAIALVLIASLAPRAPAQCGPAYDQELLPPDPQPYTDLARSVSLSGDVLATGSGKVDYEAGGPGTGFRGAAYVWRRSGGTFTFEAKIPGPPPPSTYFGDVVAIDGDVLVASQFADTYPAESVRVLRRRSGTWTHEAHLLPSDPVTHAAQQLHAVGVEGDWIAAGHFTATGAPVNPTARTGAVYLYRRDAGVWSEHAKLVPADAANSDHTGWSLDLRGEVLAFSSRATPIGSSPAPGRVHVYGLDSGSPALEAVLTASTAGEGRNFGYGISTDGTRLAVSDPDDRSVAGTIGAVYVFRRENGGWVEEQVIRPFLPAGAAAFGRELALDGDELYANDNSYWPSRLYHFRRVGGVWIEMGVAAPTNVPVWSVRFLDAQGGTLAAGAPTVYNQSGGVYTFDGGASQPVCTYCTAKVNSQGCTPAIGWTGVPSASAGSGFTITASRIVHNKNGLLFYGLTAAQAVPFQGGTLCMGAPIKRTPPQNSGGSAPCSGFYGFDFNAWIAGGSNPQLTTGALVRAQYWSRDPAASFGTNLTDALSFVIAP